MTNYHLRNVIFGVMFFVLELNLFGQSTNDFIYHISTATDTTLYLNLKGYNYDAEKWHGIVRLDTKDNGSDQYINVIPSLQTPQYVYLQPMHSKYILGVTDSTLLDTVTIEKEHQLRLIDAQSNKVGGKFELIPVKGKREGYNLKVGSHYLSRGKDSIIFLKDHCVSDNEEWKFLKVDLSIKARYPIYDNENVVYRLKSVDNPQLSVDCSGFDFGSRGEGIGLKENVVLSKNEMPVGKDRLVSLVPHKDSIDYLYIRSHMGKNYVFDVKGGARDEGTEIWFFTKHSDDQHDYNIAQLFKPILVHNEKRQYYLLQAKHSKLYLTSNGENKPLTQEKYFADSNRQKWFFEKVPNGNAPIALQNMGNNLFLDIREKDKQHREGYSLHVSSMDTLKSYNKFFTLNPTRRPSPWVTIKSVNYERVLEVNNMSDQENEPIVLRENKNQDHQIFLFETTNEPDIYRIVNYYSGMVLSVDKDLNVIQKERDKTDLRQKWRVLTMPQKYHLPPEGLNFHIKVAGLDKYWDLPRNYKPDNLGNDLRDRNGQLFQVWDIRNKSNLEVSFKKSDDSYINIYVPQTYKYVCAESVSVTLFRDHKRESEHIKFKMEVTSPTTFVLRSINNEAAEVIGEPIYNGSFLRLKELSYSPKQQFQLIYTEGPMKGNVYRFFNLK